MPVGTNIARRSLNMNDPGIWQLRLVIYVADVKLRDIASVNCGLAWRVNDANWKVSLEV